MIPERGNEGLESYVTGQRKSACLATQVPYLSSLRPPHGIAYDHLKLETRGLLCLSPFGPRRLSSWPRVDVRHLPSPFVEPSCALWQHPFYTAPAPVRVPGHGDGKCCARILGRSTWIARCSGYLRCVLDERIKGWCTKGGRNTYFGFPCLQDLHDGSQAEPWQEIPRHW